MGLTLFRLIPGGTDTAAADNAPIPLLSAIPPATGLSVPLGTPHADEWRESANAGGPNAV